MLIFTAVVQAQPVSGRSVTESGLFPEQLNFLFWVSCCAVRGPCTSLGAELLQEVVMVLDKAEAAGKL